MPPAASPGRNLSSVQGTICAVKIGPRPQSGLDDIWPTLLQGRARAESTSSGSGNDHARGVRYRAGSRLRFMISERVAVRRRSDGRRVSTKRPRRNRPGACPCRRAGRASHGLQSRGPDRENAAISLPQGCIATASPRHAGDAPPGRSGPASPPAHRNGCPSWGAERIAETKRATSSAPGSAGDRAMRALPEANPTTASSSSVCGDHRISGWCDPRWVVVHAAPACGAGISVEIASTVRGIGLPCPSVRWIRTC